MSYARYTIIEENIITKLRLLNNLECPIIRKSDRVTLMMMMIKNHYHFHWTLNFLVLVTTSIIN